MFCHIMSYTLSYTFVSFVLICNCVFTAFVVSHNSVGLQGKIHPEIRTVTPSEVGKL